MNLLIEYVQGTDIYNVLYAERLLNTMTREQIIDFLQWNDPNGIYTDERSIAEGYEPMTRDAAFEKALEVIVENTITK